MYAYKARGLFLGVCMSFNKQKFLDFIIENQVVGFFENPIVLKTGRKSHWYVNWRNVTNDAYSLDKLSDFIVEYLKEHFMDCHCIYGVPEGATKTAIVTQMKWAKIHGLKKDSHPVSMGRGKPKEHGDPKDRYFVGLPTGPTVVLEDTTTSGLSLIEAVDHLIESGVDVKMAVSLTYRSQKRDDDLTVPEYFEKKYRGYIPFLSMSNGLEILPMALEDHVQDLKVIQGIKEEFKKYGAAPLDLS